jgi:uncharacterized membrane protein
MEFSTWLTSSHFVMLGMLLGFAIAHSGLAALRPWGEQRIGPRIYRIVFALVSLPLAVVLIIYFFNHRYDGLQLWLVQGVPGIQSLVWVLSAISFLFLYPATFNLLEIAAIQSPKFICSRQASFASLDTLKWWDRSFGALPIPFGWVLASPSSPQLD